MPSAVCVFRQGRSRGRLSETEWFDELYLSSADRCLGTSRVQKSEKGVKYQEATLEGLRGWYSRNGFERPGVVVAIICVYHFLAFSGLLY